MDEFIRWPKPWLLLSSTCDDEMLSWMIEIWMKFYLGIERNCNTFKSIIPPKELQGVTNYVGLTFSFGDTIMRVTISIEQDN